jgi:asparagine synthase (glutamine-hydrolysing)
MKAWVAIFEMCGILGIIDLREPIDGHLFSDALRDLAPRGPDHGDVWVGNPAHVALGHRRLSIIDLSVSANQPMISKDGRYVIIFNGEIYNFREVRKQLNPPPGGWRTGSDTEVVLHAYIEWGRRALNELRGMFAFAIWDTHDGRLFAARDRLGVKPFYYCCVDGAFGWASRPRPLRKLMPAQAGGIDIQAVRLYLEAGYIPAPWSLYNGIKKLSAGSCLTWESGRLHVERWWDKITTIFPSDNCTKSEDELTDELESLVDQSVSYRLLSDVPVGAFLSGGIDSSLVVASMQRQSANPVKTFTIGFEHPSHDERSVAQEIANHLGTEHVSMVVTERELLDLIPDFRKAYDEPFSDSAAYPTMAVSRLARQFVTVVLSGDGGDELFGGYHYYRLAHLLSFAFRAPDFLRKSVSPLLSCIPLHQSNLLGGALAKKDLLGAITFARSIIKDFAHPINKEVLLETNSLDSVARNALGDLAGKLSPGELAARFDLTFTLPDGYLQKLDLATMAFSLEGREPLLDHALVEWGLRLPWQYKQHGGKGKRLLRRCAYRRIPKNLIDRPKQGFVMPLARWLRGPLREWMCDTLNSARLYQTIPIERSTIDYLVKEHISGRRNVQPLLWAILTLADFLENEE